MRRLFSLLLATALLATTYGCILCNDPTDDDAPAPACSTPATIRDLSACGYVLVLDNGQRLEPRGALWQHYAKHDGERVSISYEAAPVASSCMAGQGVELKCIRQQDGLSSR